MRIYLLFLFLIIQFCGNAQGDFVETKNGHYLEGYVLHKAETRFGIKYKAREDDQWEIIETENLTSFSMRGDTYLVLNHPVDNLPLYFKILAEGEWTLLQEVKEKALFIKMPETFQEINPNNFKSLVTQYTTGYPEEEIKKLEFSKSSLTKLTKAQNTHSQFVRRREIGFSLALSASEASFGQGIYDGNFKRFSERAVGWRAGFNMESYLFNSNSFSIDNLLTIGSITYDYQQTTGDLYDPNTRPDIYVRRKEGSVKMTDMNVQSVAKLYHAAPRFNPFIQAGISMTCFVNKKAQTNFSYQSPDRQWSETRTESLQASSILLNHVLGFGFKVYGKDGNSINLSYDRTQSFSSERITVSTSSISLILKY